MLQITIIGIKDGGTIMLYAETFMHAAKILSELAKSKSYEFAKIEIKAMEK